MSDYSYYQNWQRTKEYLIRSLFADTTALSPIPEEPVESSASVSEESFNPSVSDDSSNASSRSDSPPPLIIEVEPNRHDDPPEYYDQLHVRMLRLYRKLFIERYERVSSNDFGDSQDEDSNNNEETTAQEQFTESNDAVNSRDFDETVDVYEHENNEEMSAQQVIEAHESTSGNDYNESQSLTENINPEDTRTQETIEERESTSDSDYTQTLDINNEDTTPQQLIGGDNSERENDNDDNHSVTENINNEENVTQQIFEDNSESSNDYEDELALIHNNNAEDLTLAVTQEEHYIRSPILQSVSFRATRHAVLENKGDPDESASSNISITEREFEIMRGATERHQSFGMLRAISSSSTGEIEDPKCLSTANMESSIDSTPKTHPRKRQSEDDVTTPPKIVKYGNQETQTTIEDTWDSYFRFNFFEGTPKIFKLCSCRNLCDC